MSYNDDGSGTLGRNKRKERDTHPSYTGQCTIDGVGYWISAWVKENRENGEKFFSLSFRKKDSQGPRPTPRSLSDEDYSDDVPF